MTSIFDKNMNTSFFNEKCSIYFCHKKGSLIILSFLHTILQLVHWTSVPSICILCNYRDGALRSLKCLSPQDFTSWTKNGRFIFHLKNCRQLLVQNNDHIIVIVNKVILQQAKMRSAPKLTSTVNCAQIVSNSYDEFGMIPPTPYYDTSSKLVYI